MASRIAGTTGCPARRDTPTSNSWSPVISVRSRIPNACPIFSSMSSGGTSLRRPRSTSRSHSSDMPTRPATTARETPLRTRISWMRAPIVFTARSSGMGICMHLLRGYPVCLFAIPPTRRPGAVLREEVNSRIRAEQIRSGGVAPPVEVVESPPVHRVGHEYLAHGAVRQTISVKPRRRVPKPLGGGCEPIRLSESETTMSTAVVMEPPTKYQLSNGVGRRS